MGKNTQTATICATDEHNYIGIDLHSNNIVVAVVRNGIDSQSGQLTSCKVWSGKIPLTCGLKEVQQKLEPFCSQPHVAVVESTYNWYGLADLFERKNWTLLLADPTTVKSNMVKKSDDFTDAAFLADRMRLGSLRTTVPLTRNARAFRDLVRQRCSLMQDRSRYSIKLINMLNNHLYIATKRTELDKAADYLAEHGDLEPALLKTIDNVHISTKVQTFLMAMHNLTGQIELIEQAIAQAAIDAPVRCHTYIPRLLTIKGCGQVLATTIASEIDDIGRFPSVKHFVSYCRLAPTERFSNGKSKGEGNPKNGNATLSWALTELATLVVRFNPAAKYKFDKLLKKHKLRVRAIRPIAAMLARAIFQMLKNDEDFDITRCFNKLPQRLLDQMEKEKQEREQAKRDKVAKRCRENLAASAAGSATAKRKAVSGSFRDLASVATEASPPASAPKQQVTPQLHSAAPVGSATALPPTRNAQSNISGATVSPHAQAIAELAGLIEALTSAMSEGSEPAVGG